MATSAQQWEGRPVRAFLIRTAAFLLPLVFAILVAWQLTKVLPTPRTWPGVVLWWLLVMASSTMALRFADRFAKRLLPLAVLMKLSLAFPDNAPNRFGMSMKTGNAHSLEELIERAERAGREDDLTHAAETILALATALNAHDPRTRGHGDRVRAYADMLGEEMGLDAEGRNKLKWAAMLHDIGKLKVPAEIINKPGGLDDDEWRVMRRHPDWGMELAAPLLPWLGEYAATIGQHHERFDGGGYPNGIAGEEIGMAARITSVADTYDVMTSVRSYKEARPAAEAREELARCAGSQFDPIVVRAFLNISLGRQRWVAGPLSWLAQVPFFQSALQGLTIAASHAAGVVQTVSAAAAISGAAVIAPAIIDVPDLAPPATPAALPPIEIAVNDDAMVLAEDASLTFPVLGNDILEGPVTVEIVSGPEHGSATVNPDGTISYEPDPDYYGPDSLTYRACDAGGDCEMGVLSISVGEVNDPPTLGPVAAGVDEDSSINIDVLSSVSDIDGNPALATVTLAGTADTGLVLNTGAGTFLYTPPADFNGSDNFTVQVCDEGGACELFSIAVTVAPVDDAPVATLTVPSFTEDTTSSVGVDALDADEDVLTTSTSAGPAHGTTVTELDGSVTYTPDADYFGPDSFTVDVCDAGGLCATETLSFVVAAVNDPPAAFADSAATMGPGPIAVTALANDVDVEGDFDVTSVAIVAFPKKGAAVANPDGTVSYTPGFGETGSDTFDYEICDSSAACDTATVTITLLGPDAVDDAAVMVEDDPPITIDAVSNDSDPDFNLDPTSAIVLTPASSGTAAANGDGTFVYKPDPNFEGIDSFDYEVCDLAGACDVATVTITVSAVNDVPVAVDDWGVGFTTLEDLPFTTGDVTGNDTDVEDGIPDAATVTIVGVTPSGLTNNGDGTFDYSPPLDTNGDVVFSYEVDDSAGVTSNTATVTITVTAVNDAPVANDDAAGVAEDSVLGVTFNVFTNDTDVDLDTLSLASFDGSTIANGGLTDNGGGSFTYVPDPNFFGVESFTYVVSDSVLTDTGTTTITVTNVPDAPDTEGDAYATDRDVPIVEVAPGLLGNDTDYDGDILTAALATPPTNGGVVLNPDGSFSYTPHPGYVGAASFSYTADDGLNPPVPATVDLTIDDGIIPFDWYFGDAGSSPETWTFVSSPPPLGNPDPDGDGNPGLTIDDSSSGEGESDPLKFQQWLLTPAVAPVGLDGPVTLKLWSTVEFYEVDEDVDVTVFIHDCDVTGTTCGPALLSYDVHYEGWNGGVADFVYHEITIGALDHTVAVGRSLRFKLMFDHLPVWMGLNTDYPSQVSFTGANRPPATVPDAAAVLEGGGPVNVDVLANDVDSNLDPSSLSIDIVPTNGTVIVVAGPTIDYDPDPDFFGPDSFDYKICDTSAVCSTETVNVTVTSVNDVPSFLVGPDELPQRQRATVHERSNH